MMTNRFVKRWPNQSGISVTTSWKRAAEALVAIKERRLRGVLLATLGADEAQIEASFSNAIRIAREQKSISAEKRAEATYAEYRRQKTNASGGRGSD
jgi:hypothetical protein